MAKFNPGPILLHYKGEYYPRYLVGYNSKGKPVIEVANGGYMTVEERRLRSA